MGSDARGRGPRLVSDDFGRILVAGALRIAVTRAESPAPFAVDAVVLEEDTHLLLSAPPDLQTSTSSLRTALADAAKRVGPGKALQGNLDPVVLLAGWPAVETAARAVVEDARLAVAAGAAGHIFNLGHGVLPATDPQLITDLVALVHSL